MTETVPTEDLKMLAEELREKGVLTGYDKPYNDCADMLAEVLEQ